MIPNPNQRRGNPAWPDPLSIGIKCRHRRAKTRRRGLCPRCYDRFRKAVDPEYSAKIKAIRDRTWAKNRERRVAQLRSYHENRAKWKVRDSHLRRSYGISVFQYNEMARQQQYGCRICGHVVPRLNTDHCHETGRVRGLLCWQCNRGLKHFKDDPVLFVRASEYLSSDFDGRALVVPRSNFLLELGHRALASTEPIRVKARGSETTKELVVMTAATWERLNGTAEQKNFAADRDDIPHTGPSPFSSHDPGDK